MQIVRPIGISPACVLYMKVTGAVSSTFRDISSSHRTLTNNSTSISSTTIPPTGTNSIFCNGGSWIDVTDLPMTSFSFAGWIYISSAIASSFFARRQGNNYAQYQLQYDGASSRCFRLSYYNGRWTNATAYTSPTTSITQWHYIVITVTSTQIKVYVDGTLINTSTLTKELPTLTPATTHIGKTANGEYFHGYLSEITVWKDHIIDGTKVPHRSMV